VQLADLLQEGWILNTGLLGIFVGIIRIAETEVDHRLDFAAADSEVTNCVPTKETFGV